MHKTLDRAWHTGLLHKLKSYEISDQIFCFILLFSQKWMVIQVNLGGKSLQEYAVDTQVLQISMLDPTLLLLYIKDLLEDLIYNIAIYAGDTNLYSGCDQVCDLRQQLELASEIGSDLRDTVDWGRKWLVHLNAERLIWFHLSILIKLV